MNAQIDTTDPWRGLYLAERLAPRCEYGQVSHPDLPSWPDDREEALDKLVRAQGFDFVTVAGDFTDEALENGDELYWEEMRAWNPEAPEGDWRLAWMGDTEDGPYAWFVRPMALRPEPVVLFQFKDDRQGRTYIAGPMTGYADFNYPAFNAAAAQLRALSVAAINPADHGVVPGATWEDYLRSDIAQLATCESIYFLPGWSKSRGALLEHHIATALGMRLLFAEGAEGSQDDFRCDMFWNAADPEQPYDSIGEMVSALWTQGEAVAGERLRIMRAEKYPEITVEVTDQGDYVVVDTAEVSNG